MVTLLLLGTGVGCKKYLDVNKNPNAPQQVTPNLYLGPMLSHMAMAPMWDGRYVGRYAQMWTGYTPTFWDGMGFQSGSDNNSEHWRAVYWLFGYNLVNMINQAEEEERWDLLGVGYILKAWGWQSLTDMHSDIIITQAFDLSRTKFDYDSQEFAYEEVERLLKLAIYNLKREDGAISSTFLGAGDEIYKGDRQKWLKFAYGLLAKNRSHLSNKGNLYNPDDVIKYVDSAFVSNADNALMPFKGTYNDVTNFYSPARNNFETMRQTEFIVELLNGAQFDGVVDPRLSRMLAPSPDGEYRGLRPETGWSVYTAEQRPLNMLGYAAAPTGELPGHYIFTNEGPVPIMTYSELQFIKAEAAFLKGDGAVALDAYRKGVEAHLDFVNEATNRAGRGDITYTRTVNGAPQVDVVTTVRPISAAEREAFLTSSVVPTNPADLTLSAIMSQKYISLWGWGFLEAWTDLRRYHYEDVDPDTGEPVMRGFEIPPVEFLDADNAGKPVYRVRPRYNSEYIWNAEALEKIGGLERDYHTKIMWIFE